MVDFREGQRYNLMDEVIISLISNPTTGYMWRHTEVDGLSVESEYIPDVVEKGFVGSGGRQIFKVKASEPGTYTLAFGYSRSWEPGPIDTKVFELIFE